MADTHSDFTGYNLSRTVTCLSRLFIYFLIIYFLLGTFQSLTLFMYHLEQLTRAQSNSAGHNSLDIQSPEIQELIDSLVQNLVRLITYVNAYIFIFKLFIF